MTEQKPKTDKPIFSNKTSSQARDLMTKTLANLAQQDQDHALARKVKQRQKGK